MWYVLVDNRALGPHSGHDIKAMIDRGTIGRQTSLAKVGAQQWTLIGDVPAFASLLARSSAASDRASPSRQMPTAASYANVQHGTHFAGFWIRVAAYLIDTVVQYIVIFVVAVVIGIIIGLAAVRTGGGQTSKPADSLITTVVILAELAIFLGYQAIFVSSSWQATPGKRLCGIHIVRVDGRRIGVGLAIGRHLATLLSALPFYIGFMMAGWTDQKKALHDLICGTRVVYGKATDPPLAEIFD
jgi:uncharacterized RDD family membrane protein YckC